MGETKQSREFWATQLIGSEDGNYFMSEDEQTVERLAMVETKFKVIEHSAHLSLKEELREFKELHLRRLAELKEQIDKRAVANRKLEKAIEQRNNLARGRIYNGEATAERYILKLDRELEEAGE